MKKYIFVLFIFCVIVFIGCLNNDFMERYLLGNLMEEIVFVMYDNFKVYVWGLYEILLKLGYGDILVDDILYNQICGSSESNWIRGLVIVFDKWNDIVWDYYVFICCVNLMLGWIDSFQMIEVEKVYWKSVGYFFCLYCYFLLLFVYGGVFWIDCVLSDNDIELINGFCVFRDEIVKYIFEDL